MNVLNYFSLYQLITLYTTKKKIKNLNKMMLTTLIILPIIGSCAIIFMDLDVRFNQTQVLSPAPLDSGESLVLETNKEKIRSNMKLIALATSLINLLISIFIWINFDSSTSLYQFTYEFNKLSFCHFNLGIDGLSLYFVLLTTFITPIAIISNHKTIDSKDLKIFLVSFLLLESLQILAFTSLDLLLFYIFFESVLPILFILIVIFGHGFNRFRSAYLLFLYTLGGSLFMLLSILMIYSNLGTTDFQLISMYDITLDSQKILWLGFFLAFAIKTPLYPFTMWLPNAHADSVLAGSILLAATILKLATYGFLRVLINFLPDATYFFNPFVLTIASISLIYASFSTIVQQDTKKLIAYSSIAHMAVVILGLFSNTVIGIEGAILLSIAHGFVSPALFICAGGIIYDRTGTRIIDQIRGLALVMPVFTILFFIFTLANTAIPLTLNFTGEQLALLGVWNISPLIAILGASGIVLSACYSIFLYNRISYGSYSPFIPVIKDINRREFYILISLLIPTVILGIFPNIILDTLHVSVTSLLYNITPSVSYNEDINLILYTIVIPSSFNLNKNITDSHLLLRD
jgi:NADH-ubiquinone oxidoreductase chain 4